MSLSCLAAKMGFARPYLTDLYEGVAHLELAPIIPLILLLLFGNSLKKEKERKENGSIADYKTRGTVCAMQLS